MLVRLFPVFFVFLWATGFIGAGLAMPYAEPFSFMTVRFIFAGLIFGIWALSSGVVWPRRKAFVQAGITGLLIHAIYLSAIFWAVRHGLPAGIVGLVSGLQPMITLLIAAIFLGERIKQQQVLGLVAGFIGVAMVISPKLSAGSDAIDPVTLLAALIGVLAISSGTVWQKRFGSAMDLKAGTAIQYLAAGMFTLICAVLFETGRFQLTSELIIALVWLTIVISVGAVLALMVMIREGALSKVSSLFYLVPAAAAIMAYVLFGETLNLLQIAGMLVTTIGVALTGIQRKP
ncbi:drug/metabolite transporter (DMT)-like permease [Paenochrobactrum gallinarii]|uniref:Drug/metabolite transporter (DMT)-like permease n=1 Tax=Paenochrobactrum gallinarii TaxID=643673 RepID=A0A841M414_9HYPH|nr:DMT family transporter [Paenochrobactrum gallinarii]MBB6260898.1 drug/metabolite transporter (DMT)-like permease [Paenochrobactrum gallinarii]